ncbi:hypothetical protein LJC35_06585 [Parabacteroides sp. OttesenSCG-928-N08]|nr:hypothetical protein [Parabacteroides sp. OttesenSCG-928-N08]
MDNTEQNIEKDVQSLDEQELEDVAGGGRGPITEEKEIERGEAPLFT